LGVGTAAESASLAARAVRSIKGTFHPVPYVGGCAHHAIGGEATSTFHFGRTRREDGLAINRRTRISSTPGTASSSWDGTTFTITAIPEPSTYLAAAGLLALMLWPSRRRLIKDVQSIFGLRQPLRDRLAAQRES